MARELPIKNGRLTTDLDADGHRIVNLPGGGIDTVSWENVTGKPTFAAVATSGSYNDLTNKPTIPAAMTVDSALSDSSENPVQNKVVTAALNGKATAAQGAKADAALSRAEAVAGFTEWAYSGLPTGAVVPEEGKPSYEDGYWGFYFNYNGTSFFDAGESGSEDATSITFLCTDIDNVQDPITVTATRTRLPTMADIPTDNAQLINGAGYATTAAMNAALAGKADATSLPYALSAAENLQESTTDEPNDTITYGLADRTINDTSIPSGKKYVIVVMPAVSVAGHARDLVVRLTVGAADLNITWGTADAGGVAVDYETEDGNFPDLSAAGTYLVRLTETAAFLAGTGGAADVPAKFLIQCQALEDAAATQGGAA